MIRLKGETFVDKLRYILTFDEIADTNLEAVFQLILCVAVKNKLPQKELPGKLVIISDMEFNVCVTNASETNFENALQTDMRHMAINFQKSYSGMWEAEIVSSQLQ